jgi:hypothetical protein
MYPKSGLCKLTLRCAVICYCVDYWRECRAENGCFVKPIPGKSGESSWITMVANFNLKWKNTCIEILNYVR